MDNLFWFYLVIIVGGALYGIGAGFTEAAGWNILYNKDGKLLTKNFLKTTDPLYKNLTNFYHTFRLLEMLGLWVGFFLSGYLLAKYDLINLKDTFFNNFVWIIFFGVMISIYVQGVYRLAFLYERKLPIKQFAKKDFSFKFFNKNITIPNMNWYGRLVLFIGVTIGLWYNMIYICIK